MSVVTVIDPAGAWAHVDARQGQRHLYDDITWKARIAKKQLTVDVDKKDV